MLTNNEMLAIEGGKIPFNVFAVVGALLTLLAGIVDGYLRPLRCN